MKEKTAIIETNKSLLEIISPMVIEEKHGSINIGDNHCKTYGVIQYPPMVDYGWLSRLANLPSTVVSFTFSPIENGAFLDALSHNIRQKHGDAEVAKDPLARQRAEKAATDGENLLVRIDQHNETVGLLTTVVMTMAQEQELFKRMCKRVESMFSFLKLKHRTLACNQLEGYRQVAPFHISQNSLEETYGRIMPLSSLMGGFPFSSSGLNDGTGYYLAKDSSGSLVILNLWRRDNDRTNSGIVVMGIGGTGKSTATKHIIMSEFMTGTRIIAIDPEDEYKDLCSHLDGDFVNASGGKGGRINPLQIRPAPTVEDGDDDLYRDDGNGIGAMALHIKTLEVFFSLYLPSLGDMQKAVLKDNLIELYNKFGITWSTDITKLGNEDFPIMSDLYTLLKEKADSTALKESERILTEELAMMLKDVAHGSDSFLWNGHTTINTNSPFVCLSTHGLENNSDAVKRSQYFLLLLWCWQEMSRDRNEKVLLVCDEAYLMIDPNVPQSLAFLRNISKRARKYEAGIMIISHSVVDFLDPSVKKYGQALLDIPTYKLLFGTDGQNLIETANLYKLTEAMQDLLAAKQRGTALFMAGAKQIQVQFDIPQSRLDAMGSAGGR